MAKRHRSRSRARRSIDASRRASATPAAPAPRESAPAPRAHRAVRPARVGYSRAVGVPSAALERSALVERTFVARDFRRLGIVLAIVLVLLVLGGVVEGMLLP